VRFSDDKSSAADFARLPPAGLEAGGYRQPRCEGDYDDGAGGDVDELWDSVLDAESQGDFTTLRARLGAYLRVSAVPTWGPYDEPRDLQARRNSALDQLDALSALDRGSPPDAVRAYLTARLGYETGDDAEVALPPEARDPNLADNFAYLAAAFIYRDGNLGAAARAFADLVVRYPRSEKREAAMYMEGLAWLKLGVDEALQEARTRFLRQLRAYPDGRYAADARGWLAYIQLQDGDRAGALAAYYRLIAEPSVEARARGLRSLRVARPRATEGDMLRVERMLEGERPAALAYAYYELYNFAPWAGDHYDYDDPDREEHAKRNAADTLARVAAFATRLAGRGPASGAFLLRAAMADLELGRAEDASRLARRALGGLSGEERVRALFVAGSADYRLERFDEARAALEALVATTPRGPLAEQARCQLAMMAEDRRDLGGALEQYLELDYDSDVAWLVDVLMTPDQLAAFVMAHPDHPRRDALWYALGVRYLRAWRFGEARAAFARVRTVVGTVPADFAYDRRYNPKDEEPADASAGEIPAVWVARDVQTADDLEYLRERADAAAGDEAKAEALYQLASYLYECDSLRFYNPAVWGGGRCGTLSEIDYSWLRTPGESQAVWNYCRAHEPVARALDVFLDVVDKYPNTRAARDAMLSAVFCHDRLKVFNGYWSQAYWNGRHAGVRLVTGADLKAAYPDYRWPIANAWNWKPSTRTVNGHAAWPAPPKPVPPKPLWRRVRDRVVSPLAAFVASAYAAFKRGLAAFVASELARMRLSFLTLALLAAAAATYRSSYAAVCLVGWRAVRAIVRLGRRAARRPGAPDALADARASVACVTEARASARASGSRLFELALPPDRFDRLFAAVDRGATAVLRTRTGLALLILLPPLYLVLLLVAAVFTHL
jgi:outer membrane protein assembly factor BamD (BamD/ComL family)